MMVYMYSKTETIDDGERKERQGAERNELEIRYERYRGILKNLTLMSDVFMRNVFKERECTEYVLQVIMGRKDLKITDQVLQKDYKFFREDRRSWTVWHRTETDVSLTWRSSRIRSLGV